MAISQNITTNTNSADAVFDGPVWVHVSGTFDSATAKLQFEDNGTWRDVDGVSGTSAFDKLADFPSRARHHVRVNVAGGGGSLDVNVYVTGYEAD